MINDMKYIGLRNLYYKYIKSNRYPLREKSELDKKVSSLKDIHKGEACFVIGNGPSLTAEDLDSIADCQIPSFAANYIFKMYDKTKWRPTYLVFQDQQVIDGLADMFGELAKSCEKLFVRRDVYKQISPEVLKSPKLILPRLVMHIRKDKLYDFSSNLANCAYDGCTVTYFMIQIAYYMGFKKIYVIGVDHNFPIMFDENDNVVVNKELRMHCFDDPKHIVLNPARILETTFAYRSANSFLKEHHVEIYNATRGGKLEEFERIDVESVLKGNTNDR